MELKWALPDETKLNRLQEQVQEIPEKPDGLSETQMQEALQTKVLWMLSCFYSDDSAELNKEARSVYQWLHEADTRGYQGYVWDYLNLELLKLDARIYRKREQWEEVEKDLAACEPIVSRLLESLQTDSITPEDRLCLAVSCAETDILRYYEKKQTGSVLEGYRALGEVSRCFRFELPQDPVRSGELRTLAGLQLLMGSTKINTLSEKEKAALAAKQGSGILNETRAYFGGTETKLSAVLSLYGTELYEFNYADHPQEEWDRFIEEAANLASQSQGKLPGEIERKLEALKHPKLDWRSVLTNFIHEEVNDYSFSPPDRRFEGDFFLPDFNDVEVTVKNILFMVDTSGSMSERMITEMYSEIHGAIEQFNGKLSGWLGFFDAVVVPPKSFDSVENFKLIRPKGGGGTDFSVIFKYIKDKMQDNMPQAVVILTDGYAEFPDVKETMGIPVLWVINTDVQPPFGQLLRV